MSKFSKRWLQVYTYTMRYVATIVSFSTFVIDVLILFNKTTIITYSIAGGSLLTLFVIYCGIRFLGYCYIQRCLLWLTGMNIIFNAFIGYFKFSGWHIIEYLFITLLLIVEFLAIRRYYIELKNGELESDFHFIDEKKNNNELQQVNN